MRVCVCACLNGELLLKEWAENWKNWLVALAHRQNGYRLSAEHAGEVLLHQLLEESCAPTSRSVPRRGSAGYCAFSETWHFAERTVTCLRDPWLENLSSLPPPLTLSCEIGLIGTNVPPDHWALCPPGCEGNVCRMLRSTQPGAQRSGSLLNNCSQEIQILR